MEDGDPPQQTDDVVVGLTLRQLSTMVGLLPGEKKEKLLENPILGFTHDPLVKVLAPKWNKVRVGGIYVSGNGERFSDMVPPRFDPNASPKALARKIVGLELDGFAFAAKSGGAASAVTTSPAAREVLALYCMGDRKAYMVKREEITKGTARDALDALPDLVQKGRGWRPPETWLSTWGEALGDQSLKLQCGLASKWDKTVADVEKRNPTSTSARTNEFKAIAEPAWEKASRGIMRSLRRVYNEHMRAEGEARIPKNCVFNLIDGPDEWAEPPEDAMETAWRRARAKFGFTVAEEARAELLLAAAKAGGYFPSWDLSTQQSPEQDVLQTLLVLARCNPKGGPEALWERAIAKVKELQEAPFGVSSFVQNELLHGYRGRSATNVAADLLQWMATRISQADADARHQTELSKLRVRAKKAEKRRDELQLRLQQMQQAGLKEALPPAVEPTGDSAAGAAEPGGDAGRGGSEQLQEEQGNGGPKKKSRKRKRDSRNNGGADGAAGGAADGGVDGAAAEAGGGENAATGEEAQPEQPPQVEESQRVKDSSTKRRRRARRSAEEAERGERHKRGRNDEEKAEKKKKKEKKKMKALHLSST